MSDRWGEFCPIILLSKVVIVFGFKSAGVKRTHDKRASAGREPTADGGGGLDPIESIEEATQIISDLKVELKSLQLQKQSMMIQLKNAEKKRLQDKAILNSINDPVIISTLAGDKLQINPSAARLFHLSADAGECTAAEIAGDPSWKKLIDDLSLMQQSAKLHRQSVEYRVDVQGKRFTYAASFSAITDDEGVTAGIVALLQDKTKDLEVSQVKTEFVSMVSHELRTPLSSIKAYAELLVDGEADDENTRRESYRVIQLETDRLSRLIDNILNISRIEAGISNVQKKRVSLNSVLKRVIEVLTPVVAEKRISLVDQTCPTVCSVIGDYDMLYQATLNLVSNAAKYTPQGGTIRLVMEPDEENREVHISVIDTGVGISPQNLERLFEKFFRVEEHKTMAKGSGLGLNLTRQLIEQVHEGRMIVKSEVGKGSTFGFVLTLA